MGPDGKLSIEKAGERIGALWKDMPSSEKSAYEKEAESAKATYLQEFTSWSGSLKAGQLQKIEKIVGQKIRAPGGRKKTLGGHHPPQSAYTLWYIESLRNGKIVAEDSAVTATEKVASTGRQAGAMWKSMSDEEKQVSRLKLPGKALLIESCSRTRRDISRRKRTTSARSNE